MNKIFVFSFYALMLLTIQSCCFTAKDSNDHFKTTIIQCNNCHSATASMAMNAPALDGMDDEYLIEQLKNFRFDKRGANSLSPATREMSRQAKALQDNELSRIADYYESLSIANSTETVPGNINTGQVLYDTHCGGCHSSFIGRLFTNSPKVDNLNGPYILEQLTLFAANKRNSHVENKHKKKMIEVSKLFSNKEFSDIAAYLKSNQFVE